MLTRLFKLQKTLEKLEVLAHARMPEAQRRMEQGDDLLFHDVTAVLEHLTAAQVIVRDLIVCESGSPDFGTGIQLVEEVKP